MALTQGQVNTFKGKGFFVIKGFFNPSEVAQISAWLDELRDKQPASGGEAKYYEISPISDENILVRIENVIGDHNRVASDLLISDKTEDCLAQLVGEAPLLFK